MTKDVETKNRHHCKRCKRRDYLVNGLCQVCLRIAAEASAKAQEDLGLKTLLADLDHFHAVMERAEERIQTRIGMHSIYERYFDWDEEFVVTRITMGVPAKLFDEYRQAALKGELPPKEQASFVFGWGGNLPMSEVQKKKRRR